MIYRSAASAHLYRNFSSLFANGLAAASLSHTHSSDVPDSLSKTQIFKLLDLMQLQTRLSLHPTRLQKARNFLSANSHTFCSIFGAFLYHCGLPLPHEGGGGGPGGGGGSPDGDGGGGVGGSVGEGDARSCAVSVQVLECFEQAISLILGRSSEKSAW
jgi:hypothetical protein